jgi:hypothetical protein
MATTLKVGSTLKEKANPSLVWSVFLIAYNNKYMLKPVNHIPQPPYLLLLSSETIHEKFYIS